MNIADGELMEGVLHRDGYDIVGSAEEADVVLINTCAIREHAERRVLGRVGQLNALKMERPDLVIGVTGCMAQRIGDDLLAKAPYVDLVMGPDGYRGLPEALDNIRPKEGKARRLSVLGLSMDENYVGLEQRRRSNVSAWVPIQRGCDHRCTFCIVPYVRGSEKNREPQEVLDEIRAVVDQGITEVTLLGQTVNSYAYGDWSFARLLREVAQVPGIRRVRFTSPHPNDVTVDLVEVMAQEPTICEQFHLPAQSGNNRTLKRMLRRYTVESLLEKVDLIRATVPDVALSTDIIVAFPGETEAEFRDTLDLIRKVRFDDAFTYKYSLREGTPATRFPESDFISSEEGQERLAELIRVSRDVQSEINRGELGRTEELLIEREGRDSGMMLGRTRRGKAVVVKGEPDEIWAYRTVVLTRTTGATFVGEALVCEALIGEALVGEAATREALASGASASETLS